MRKQLMSHTHCRKYNRRKGRRLNDPDTRAMLADRFVTMYRSAGLDKPALAKFLHVSERTLHNWESGLHEIPYATYKLVRILTRYEFPDPAWRGWHMHSGKLWSPEGYGFTPSDSSWWSLLCRRAVSFNQLYDQLAELKRASRAHQGPPGPRGARSALDLSLGHFRTRKAHSLKPCALRHGVRVQPDSTGVLRVVSSDEGKPSHPTKGGLV
jgi:DNA-binding transcriptional regulator YiaG